CERALVNVFPRRTDAAEIQGLVGDRLGAVVNQEDEAQGERPEPGETKYKADHGVSVSTLRPGEICVFALPITALALTVQLFPVRSTCRCGRACTRASMLARAERRGS